MIHKLNEYVYQSNGRTMYSGISNYDLYNFATKVIVPLCMKYIEYAFWCKAKTSEIKSKSENGLHRAAFNAVLTSLNNDKAKDKHRVLCKIYNPNRGDDCVAIDYTAIIDGYYDLIAAIIDGSVYYLPLSEVYRYQSEMGNACISKTGRYINIAADYFIDHSAGSYEMELGDKTIYNNGFDKYIVKPGTKLTESFNPEEQYDLEDLILHELISAVNDNELQSRLSYETFWRDIIIVCKYISMCTGDLTPYQVAEVIHDSDELINKLREVCSQNSYYDDPDLNGEYPDFNETIHELEATILEDPDYFDRMFD